MQAEKSGCTGGFAGQGLGSALVNHLAALYQGRFQEMQVGTSDNGSPFYRRLGFLPSHVVANFFVDNYPEPIFDGGQQCVDMVFTSSGRCNTL